jgi:prevent-host-death family protein
MTPKTSQPSSAKVPASVSTAEAKRRFSELVDRVGEGETFLVSRRGRPAVALVPPTPELLGPPREPPRGLASLAGALADWEELDSDVAEIYATRRTSKDRPAPDLG